MNNDMLDNGDDFKDQANANEIELRDLVVQALEQKGFLTHFKAQLRAAIFKTVEDCSDSIPEQILSTKHELSDEAIIRGLFLDWLEHSHLLYTKDVFQTETSTTKVFDRKMLIESLGFQADDNNSSSLIEILLRTRQNHQINQLPEHAKQSIDSKFTNEKINDMNAVREHFRSLFNGSFDVNLLDVYINKLLPSNSSISKSQYEQICLKWFQSCAQVSQNVSANTTKSNGLIVVRPRRDLSLFGDSSCSSSTVSSTISEQP